MTDLYLPSYDMQVTAAIRAIPKLDGLRYLVLGGNHDYDAIKSGGQDMIRRLCAARDDMTYCGYDVHDVALTDRADIRMWHPSGGVPYAVSYRLQKGMESAAYEQLQTAIVEDTTPNLRAVIAGHLHIEAELSRGAIFGIQAGCFEGQTNFLKRKGLFPQVGGYHIQVWLTDSGLIQRRVFEFVPFHEIRADWRNYPELWRESDEPEQEPLFTWKAT